MRWFTIKIAPGVKIEMRRPAPRWLAASVWVIGGALALFFVFSACMGLLMLRPSLLDAIASRFHRSARAVTFDKGLTLTVPPLWQVRTIMSDTFVEYYEFDIRGLSVNRVSWLFVEAMVEPRASIERNRLYETGQWQTMAVGGVAARSRVMSLQWPAPHVSVNVVVEDKNTFIYFTGREEQWIIWRAALENAVWKEP